ncbi:MAG: DUF3419 family protein [Candidatus Omnitrophota bacterium]
MPVNTAIKIREAVENRSTVSIRRLQQRLFSYWFDGLVYNQIWEDPRVDMEAMELDSSSRILAISSGGCNLLNYLVAGPHSIRAVDLNFNHICFTRLKLAAMKRLPDYNRFFQFFGSADREANINNYYQYIQPHLDRETRQYWETKSLFRKSRIRFFANNVYSYSAMANFILLANVLSKRFAKDPQELLAIQDSREREEFFEKHFAPFFDHWLVKGLGRLPFLFYGLGIPPQQFDSMKKECNGQLNRLYRKRIKSLACDFPIEENYFAWQAFCRRYDVNRRIAIPDYLKEENYETIKKRIDAIHLNYTSLTEYLHQQPDKCLNRFVFLDSQDWMDAAAIAELWTEVVRTGMPGSRVIFRTASNESPIETALPAHLRKHFVYEETRSRELYKKDRSAIYGGFHLYVLQ